MLSHRSTSGSKTFVLFLIDVSPGLGQRWIVKRRFSDFVYLDKQLRRPQALNNVKWPVLPRKRYFGSSTEPRFVEERRQLLEEYLQTLVQIPHVWVRSDFARFLDNESNSMIFIWNFDRVKRMQEVGPRHVTIDKCYKTIERRQII